jgi:RNA polymerase subunit RPABC4/transcription elongation factor Spt4
MPSAWTSEIEVALDAACEIRVESTLRQSYSTEGCDQRMSEGHQGGLAGLWAVGGRQVSGENDQARHGYYQFCPGCGWQMTGKFSTCPKCGADLRTKACPYCGGAIPVDSEVCPRCTAPLL